MTEDITILMTSIIALLISAGVGVFGIMGVYQAYPELVGIPEPICECPEIQDEYDRPRQTASVLGFFIGTPIILGWWIWARLGTKEEVKS